MTIHEIWLLALSIATPLAGIIGFSINLRELKQRRLENEKLTLEVAQLKNQIQREDQRVVIPTTDEVVKYADLNSRFRGPCPGADDGPYLERPHEGTWTSGLTLALRFAFVTLLIAYAIFDAYRLFTWIAGMIG